MDVELSPTTPSVSSPTTTPQQQQQTLVDTCRHLLRPNGSIVGRQVAETLLPLYPHLPSALLSCHAAAIQSIDDRQPLTHYELQQFVQEMGRALHSQLHLGRNHRVAVCLENGPQLAVCIVVVSCWCTCVPFNAHGATQELANDLRLAQIDHLIGLASNVSLQEICQEHNIPFTGLLPHKSVAGLFQWILSDAIQQHGSYQPPKHVAQTKKQTNDNNNNYSDDPFAPSSHSDDVLLLFTSGTTGQKKLVIHKLADVLVAAGCIAVSWKLTPDDTNCNLMPLFHIGGIIRQVYSPILSGGSVICCPNFDPSVFWSLLEQNRFSWYYAAPTMHQMILEYYKNEQLLLENASLRMIANAAGGLSPSLARELHTTFSAHILPSYGMTECMPISSPPSNYLLEKPGTSGVCVGPEIAILNLETVQELPTGTEGPICVRGEPCFRGYGSIESETVPSQNVFLPGGWFNTGDLGYMDDDGYLYITGRAKEVINRGGEIISPMEVEEAVQSHPNIVQCVAFSTSHCILQEVVGILVVPNSNAPRIDLPTLHEYLGQGRLAAPKWPQCLVYIDAVPKSFTNKLLRVRLGKRLSLPELNDTMYSIERTFQAKCPAVGAAVSMAIPCERVSVSQSQVQDVLRRFVLHGHDLVVVPHLKKLGSLVVYVNSKVDRLGVVKIAKERLHGYLVPSHVCVCYSVSPTEAFEQQLLSPPQSSDAIGSILQEAKSKGCGPTDPLVMELQELFQVLLNLDCLPAPDTNFFNLGGSSMMASQLASRIRKLHSVPFGGFEIFHFPSCNAIAATIRERRSDSSGIENMSEAPGSLDRSSMAVSSLYSHKLNLSKTPFESTRMEVSPGYAGVLIQLLPLFLIYPLWQLTRFFLFFRVLELILNRVPMERNIYLFILTIIVFHTVWIILTPLLFVAVKWTLIGKYKKGRYPIWGSYYLRWWLVDVMRKLIGNGAWGAHWQTLAWYYRILGARIGKGTRISLRADIAEYDLVTIGDGAAVEFSTVRGFGVDNGCMILGPVRVGSFASVGVRSVVAPFTSIEDGSHLGPVSSSYEKGSNDEDDVDNLRYNRQALPEPSLLSDVFVIRPITFIVKGVSQTPALLVFMLMVSMPWNYSQPFHSVGDLIEWLANPRRIPFYVGIRIARAIASPLVYMSMAILVKKCIIGKFEAGPRDTHSEWQLIRHELAAILFSRENMQDVTDLIGRHHELVSCLYRLLGAKVGKRVFWPGDQPIFSGEFDLLEIGDDVVFGSRAVLLATTIDSCEKIILCAGSNVSDNTVVLPGSILGKGAVLGSNALCPENRYLPEASVWLGARNGEPVLLERGTEEVTGMVKSSDVNMALLQLEGDESTIRPFGKAVYKGEADYFVLPLPLIILYTLLVRALVACLVSMPILGALHLSAGYFYGWPVYFRGYNNFPIPPITFFAFMLFAFQLTHALHVCIWLGVEKLAKTVLIGQRQEGRHNWDTTKYGMNWELYQIVQQAIRDLGRVTFLDFICGTPYIVSYFRMLGCSIGNDCCLYPSSGDPYMPEPDLVEIGDRAVIDCASVVCHLNTRGNFELSKIRLFDRVTLRTRSRVQSGVIVESGAMVLEKALALTGEVIEMDSIWVGAPASRLLSYDTSSIATKRSSLMSGSQNDGSRTGGEIV